MPVEDAKREREGHCPCAFCTRDHDNLNTLMARFDEFRTSNDLRLEKLNELRMQVETDRNAFMRSDVFDIKHEQLLRRMAVVESWRDRVIGMVAFAVALASTFGIIVGHWWK